MKLNIKNIRKAAEKWVDEYGFTTENNKYSLTAAYIAGAITAISNSPPTHCRFKNKNKANFWGCTTKEWLGIESIRGDRVSTYDFAWVDADDLEFKSDVPYMCSKCHENEVMRQGGVCDNCYDEGDGEDDEF